MRGGNANNSATVLAHLGFQAEFLGTIAEGQAGEGSDEGLSNDIVQCTGGLLVA